MSFARSTMRKYPLLSTWARSPVRNQPPWKLWYGSPSCRWYPLKTVGPRHTTSPISPAPGATSTPSGLRTLTSVRVKGRPEEHSICTCSGSGRARTAGESSDMEILPHVSVMP